MLEIIENIPDINQYPLTYVFETMNFKHKPETLWLEFGVAKGKTINYISKFTNDTVYGFDTFTGLPEKWREGFDKGLFSQNGNFPKVNKNVILIKGMFEKTLVKFLKEKNKKISFLHIDADLYSSTKYVLENCKNYIEKKCVIVFDELVNYPGFAGENGELRALYEFVTANKVEYTWIGMNGSLGMTGYRHQNAALIVDSIY